GPVLIGSLGQCPVMVVLLPGGGQWARLPWLVAGSLRALFARRASIAVCPVALVGVRCLPLMLEQHAWPVPRPQWGFSRAVCQFRRAVQMGDLEKAARKAQEFRQREREILDAALALFLEQGEDRVTVEMIADRVGIGKGTIYK